MNNERFVQQRKTVERLLHAINNEKKQTIPGVHTPDFVAEDMTWGLILANLEDAAAFGDMWIAALGDYKMDLVEFFSSGPNGVFTWIVHFNVPGKAGGTKRISMRGVSILEFTDDNLIRRETAYQDLNALRKQLDLPPLDLSDLGERLGDLALVNAHKAKAT